MSCSLNSGIVWGTTIGLIKGDTRSLGRAHTTSESCLVWRLGHSLIREVLRYSIAVPHCL